MFANFYPDRFYESAYIIEYDQIYAEGFRGIIFDVDNTLVPHGAPADERSIQLFKTLHELGFEVLLLSNNKEPRVKSFSEQVIYAKYIYKGGKPSKRGYLKAMEIMGTNKDNTLFVGDQLFTDVWGAKRSGLRSYLTSPIHPKEEIQIVLKRRLERIVLFFYKRICKKENRPYMIKKELQKEENS